MPVRGCIAETHGAPGRAGTRVKMYRWSAVAALGTVSYTIAPVSCLPIKRMRGRQREDLSCLASTPMMITSPDTQLHPCGNPELHLNSSRHPPLCVHNRLLPLQPAPTAAPRPSCCQGCGRLRGTYARHRKRIVSPPLKDHPWTGASPRTLAQSMLSPQASRAAVSPLAPGSHPSVALRPATPAPGRPAPLIHSIPSHGGVTVPARHLRHRDLEPGRCDKLPVRCHSGWPGATADESAAVPDAATDSSAVAPGRAARRA